MLVYVAGPYNGPSHEAIDQNIQNAREVAIAVWQAGMTAICPHLNTARFEVDAGLPESRYLLGDLEILSKCDAIVMTPDWERSKGATKERHYALGSGIPVYVYPDLPKPA